MTQTQLPDGYRQDARGALIPESKIKPIDLARDALVQEIVKNAQMLSEQIGNFKLTAFGDMQAFVEMSAEQYGAKLGGQKGNVSLVSFDGRYKVQRAVAESITFDERLQAAKSLIDECIHDWSEGANDNIRVLVNDAFQVDKEGNINTGRVLSLKRLNIIDDKWKSAMDAISEAVQVTGSRTYIRVYERIGDTDKWEPIPLDIASV
jgi:hypothetical protein